MRMWETLCVIIRGSYLIWRNLCEQASNLWLDFRDVPGQPPSAGLAEGTKRFESTLRYTDLLVGG